MAEDKNSNRLSSALFIVFITFHVSVFVALTVIQFVHVGELEAAVKQRRSEIDQLTAGCDRPEQKRGLESLHSLAKRDESFAKIWNHVSRRQALSIADLMHQVLLEQEKQLNRQCTGNVKICLKGAKGNVGAAGVTGESGLQGQKGQPGGKGSSGLTGIKGEKGPRGPKGDKGDLGDVGPAGLAGVRGPKGVHGIKGTDGSKGVIGQIGDVGEKGDPGSQGAVGLKGALGAKGEIGPKGEKGSPGTKGEAGEVGSRGPAAVLSDDQKGCQCSNAPTFNDKTTTEDVDVGSSTNIDCSASGSPSPTVTWSRPTACRPFSELESSHSVHHATWQDGGIYECSASNMGGTVTKQVFVNITGSEFCDFETDTCSWTPDRGVSGLLPWSRHAGTTPTSATGPSNDHTLKNRNGHYIYLETSGRAGGEKARVQSALLPANTDACLKYWYNMNGVDVGALNVYTKTCKGTETRLQSLTANRGDNWIETCSRVTSPPYDYTFVIEGVVGDSYHGDIAVDDVTISTNENCNCQIDIHRKCLFDVDTCDWTQDKASDRYDWRTGTGSTLTLNTGPSGDHTSGNGNYIYIETSNMAAPGDFARLVSSEFPAGQPYCIDFYYSMYGQSIGTLNLYIKNHDGTLHNIFTKSGDQGQQWQHGVVTVPSQNAQFSFVIEGTRGASYTGDIAIDDVTVDNGACSTASP